MNEPLFSKYDLGAVLDNRLNDARKEIDSYKEDYLLTVSETDLVKFITSNHIVHPILLGEAAMLDPVEVDVDIGNNPFWGASIHGKHHVKGHRVEVHIPFTGDPDLFQCRPASFTFSPPHAVVYKSHLALIYDRPGALNGAEVRKDYDIAIGQITTYINNIKAQCEAFNTGLESKVHHLVSQRKNRLLQIRQAAASIGIPLKRRSDAPQTYLVPDIKRKAQVGPPRVREQSFTPEPAIDEQEFENVLNILRSMVSVMERSPKAFIDMGEENLRSHFLVQLNGQYHGRATGETFNYEGKTDILIRERDRNVFIAECKIWKGEAELAKAIDQILGYLHWRDTKAALLLFNRNKAFSDVLSKIPDAVQSHVCCKRLIKKRGDSEWRFLFRNPDDANRELQLAVMAFDVPRPEH